MNTDQNPDFPETGDQISSGDDQLSQETERSEGTPSWGQEEPEGSFEDQPEYDDVDSEANEDPESDYTEETGDQNEPTEETEDEPQEETLPGDSRRVLSFGDFFKDRN